ncbi:MAG TPA: 30S ribosomal protein S6 [Planctomycetes bacterium]|nr:30S ribosomal protein S6 [Planctomycetota bacterium]
MSETTTPAAEPAAENLENRVLKTGKLALALTHERKLPRLDPEVEAKTRLYELCILFDPNEATRTWDTLVSWIKDELIEGKYGQHVLQVDKWADARKLAYEIAGLKRGTYMVVWFRSETDKINDLERDLRLDDRSVRHVVIHHPFEPPTVGKTAEDFDQKAEEERSERGADRRGPRR